MNSNMMTRRAMLTGAAATASTALLAGCKTTVGSSDAHACCAAPAITLKQGATVLLQGDSITDAGRSRETENIPNDFAMLGNGYAKLIAYHLLSKYPDKQLKIYNRGISGHKVPDLDARWDKDTINLKPDVLSIMIGVNDYWHTVAFGSKYKGTVDDYETGFKALLKRTKDALPDVQLVVCEPFVVRAADGTTRPDWFPEFDDRRARAKLAAESFGAVFVPFQAMFDAAVMAGSKNKDWSGDDIHVNEQGAALMAMRWLGDTGLA